jgi:hypothetical protein
VIITFVVVCCFVKVSLEEFFFTIIWTVDLVCCTVNRPNGQNLKYHVSQKQKNSLDCRHARIFVERHNNISILSFPSSLWLGTRRREKKTRLPPRIWDSVYKLLYYFNRLESLVYNSFSFKRLQYRYSSHIIYYIILCLSTSFRPAHDDLT